MYNKSMARSGITEKKMRNKRFYKTEYAIFIAYYSFKNYPTAKMLARRAHIARSTLYRHHRRTEEIPHDYEELLVSRYDKYIKKYCLKENFNFRKFFLYLLVYIVNNRVFFLPLFRDGRDGAIIRMLRHVRPFILDKWHLDGDMEKMYSVYTNEILGVIETWAKHNFSKKMLGQTLDDIMYLTNSARIKLAPLLESKVTQVGP